MYCSKEEDCGYDMDFIQEVPDTLMCILCHMVLREPVQVMACGHRFCTVCYQRMKTYSIRMKTDLRCPTDREIINTEKVFEDTAAAREIRSLMVKCSNNTNGCTWEGELRNVKDHLETCEAKKNSESGENDQGKKDEQYSNLFTQAFQRIDKCESDLLKKDKEIACLKLNLHEIKIKNIDKDAAMIKIGKEVKWLKEKNCQHEAEIERLKEESRIRSEEIRSKSIHKDAELVEVRKEVRSMKEKNCQNEAAIEKLKEENTKRSEELKTMQDSVKILEERVNNNKGNTIENETLVKLKEDLRYDLINVNARIYNCENYLFYTNIVAPKTTVYIWKLRHYQYYSNNKNKMGTAIFNAPPTRYRCRLTLEWGENKKNDVGLYFTLYKSLYEEAEKPFSMMISFKIIDKYGNEKNLTITPDEIEGNRDDSFTIHAGENKSRCDFGFPNMLTMPEDEAYIINDTLTITCSLTHNL